MLNGSILTGFCEVCGEPIVGRNKHSKYCSRKCLKKKANEKYTRSRGVKPRSPPKTRARPIYQPKIKEIYCGICGCSFNGNSKTIYCSPECALAAIKQREAKRFRPNRNRKPKPRRIGAKARLPYRVIAKVILQDNDALKDLLEPVRHSGRLNDKNLMSEEDFNEHETYRIMAHIFGKRYLGRETIVKNKTIQKEISELFGVKYDKSTNLTDRHEENRELYRFFIEQTKLIREKYFNANAQKTRNINKQKKNRSIMQDIGLAAAKELPFLNLLHQLT
jgi:hypothetical protein